MKGQADRIIPDFSVENLKDLEGYSINSERPQMPELSIVSSEAINYDLWRKTFHYKNKFEYFISTNPVIQKVLEENFLSDKVTIPKMTQGINNIRTVNKKRVNAYRHETIIEINKFH